MQKYFTKNIKTSKILFILFFIVVANYLVQIPYALHLYGFHINPFGAVLLTITLLWFLSGFLLLVQKTTIGYWLLLAFFFVEFLFYFHGQIILAFFGYGLLYHLFRFNDMILWITFFIGDINFLTAGYAIIYLVENKRLFIT